MEPVNKQIVLERRKAHSDQISSIAVSPTQNDIIATTSDDKTIRIWDLRMNSSVKRIKCQEFSKQFSNCTFSNKSSIFVGCGTNVLSFELRKQQIFIDKTLARGESQNEQINHIAFDKSFSLLGACDDLGDARLYNQDLQNKGDLDQKHLNVAFCLDFINPQNKPPVCVTSGFDCKLVFWNVQNSQAIRQIQIGQTFKDLVTMHCPPHVYCMIGLPSSILVGTQSGHVACFNLTGPKKPRMIFSANLNKILRMTFAKFKKNLLLTLNGQQTFSMFDYEKRTNQGIPTILNKYTIPFSGNWIQTTVNNTILVADKSNDLSIYRIQ